MIQTRVFLSYSSSQEKLVTEIAKELGASNINIDKWTFESGYKTWDEILQALSNTGLFVLLVSRTALNSDWVKKEVNKAKQLMDSGELKGFFAINIDNALEITSRTPKLYPEFPQWIFDEYNLQKITSPSVIASKIKSKLNSVRYELDSDYRKLRDIYFGRDDEKALAKRRIADRMQEPISCVIVSGFHSIGRKKFLKKVLEEVSILRVHQEPPLVVMGENESVENFIVRLYSTNYTQLRENDIHNLAEKSLEEKYKIAVDALVQIGAHSRVLIIEDANAIVDFGGVLAEWFDRVISDLSKIKDNRLLPCLITKTKINGKFLSNKRDFFQIPLKPLSKNDCVALFNTLCDLEQINIDNPQHIEMISDTFNGNPDQVFYAVYYIANDSLVSLLQNLEVLKRYNFTRAADALSKFKGEKERQSKGLLKTLSLLNTFSLDIVDHVIAPIYGADSTYEIISNFTSNHIVELLKYDSFVYQVNRAIRIYVATNKDWKEDSRISKALEKFLIDNIKKLDEFLSSDFPLYELLIKESLVHDWKIDNKLVLPSYQFNLIVQKFREGRYDEVFKIAENLFDNAKNLDQFFLNRVYEWYCKALIKDNQGELFNKKVNMITDKATRLMLFGFFHRRNHRYATAIENLKRAEGMRGGGIMLLRELALCYSDIEDYVNAYTYARRFYESSPPNPFSANLFFRSLVRHPDLDTNYKSILQKLLDELNQMEGDDGENYLIAKSQFHAFIESNKEEAYENINRAIELHSEKFNHSRFNGYPLLDKMSYCSFFKDTNELSKTISEFEEKLKGDKNWLSMPQYLKNKMRYYELINDKVNTEKYRAIYLERSRSH